MDYRQISTLVVDTLTPMRDLAVNQLREEGFYGVRGVERPTHLGELDAQVVLDHVLKELAERETHIVFCATKLAGKPIGPEVVQGIIDADYAPILVATGRTQIGRTYHELRRGIQPASTSVDSSAWEGASHDFFIDKEKVRDFAPTLKEKVAEYYGISFPEPSTR